jgi:hypothetical protein
MAAAIGIIGGVVSAMGAIQQGKAQADAANYQAQVARNNEIIALQQAAYTRQEGAAKAQQQDLQSAQLIGKQKATLGASGVDIESGSPLEIQASQASLARLDALTVQSNAERKAWGFDVEATNQKAQAGLYHMQAANAKKAATLAAFSSLLGGFGKFAGKWSGGGGAGGSLSSGTGAIGDIG